MYQPDFALDRASLVAPELETLGGPDGASLDAYTGLLVRVPRIQVLDNCAGFPGTNPAARVYPIFVCVTDRGAVAVEGLAAFAGIRDGMDLPLSAENPVTIFRQTDGLPRFVDLHVLVMRSLQAERDVAGGIHAAMASTEGKTLQAAIQTLVTSANPVAGAISSTVMGLVNLVTEAISKSKDPQIFYGRASLERVPEKLGIGKTLTLGLPEQHRAVVELSVVGLP